MADTPETRYVRMRDGTHVAFQVSGSGPVDLVPLVNGHGHLDYDWTFPLLARFIKRLSSFSRVIRFDARGTGMSDRASPEDWAVEAVVADLLAVLDTVGVERAALMASNLTGIAMIQFAAAHPDRTSALVLDGCFARFTRDGDYRVGLPADVLQLALDRMTEANPYNARLEDSFGIEALAPSFTDDPEFVSDFGKMEHAGSSPVLARRIAVEYLWRDVRDLLPKIAAPTLVLCRTQDAFAGPRHGHYLADHIPGAKYVELPGIDNLSYVGDTDALLGEIEEFLTGARHRQELDRVVTTILFTDIVESTGRAAAIGDRGWRELLDRHDEICREEIDAFRGQFVKSTGDGVVAMFDGATRAIRCAQAIAKRNAAIGLDVRSGVHTGEVEHRAGDLHGLAVHVAQRVSSLAGAGEVLASETVIGLVGGSDITFADHGDHELKGVPGTWRLSLVTA